MSCVPMNLNGVNANQRPMCFKTRKCSFFLQGKCNRGNDCTFAHDNVELRNTPDLSKTKICHLWRNGRCNKVNCNYAHGEQELKCARTGMSVPGELNISLPKIGEHATPSKHLMHSEAHAIEECLTDVSVYGSAMSPASSHALHVSSHVCTVTRTRSQHATVTQPSTKVCTAHSHTQAHTRENSNSYDERNATEALVSYVSSPVLPSTASPESLQMSPHAEKHARDPLDNFSLDAYLDKGRKASHSLNKISASHNNPTHLFTDHFRGNILAYLCANPLSEETIRGALYQAYVE